MKDIAMFEKLRGRFEKLLTRHTLISFIIVSASFLILDLFVCLSLDTTARFHYVNILYSIAWSVLAAALFQLLPRRGGVILYFVVYYILLLYGAAQYFYHEIFNKLFSFTVFANINEGAGYIDIIIDHIGVLQIIVFAAMLLLPVFSVHLISKLRCTALRERIVTAVIVIAVFSAAECFMPSLLGQSSSEASWDSFNDLRYVYDNYTDPHKCLGMVGYYQFLSCDFYNCFLKGLFSDRDAMRGDIEQFFKDYPNVHEENDYTGIFEGKNVIIVMLESVDYIAISEENTPNIWKMMSDGIVFSRYYSAIYGDGATFANEFLMNTGLTAPASGTAAYAYISNTFSQSLPTLFRSAGYTANSFHKNYGWFYNRELMHSAFGYEKYTSYYEFGTTEDEVNIDTFLTDSAALTEMLFADGEAPFMNFVITYSAHLPYTYTDALTLFALENYGGPSDVPYEDEDLYTYCAKVRITDAMLGALLERADEDTVFVCVADHFAYGLDEDTLVEYKGSEWALRQNTSFFIYCKDPSTPRMTVDKLCSNVDFLPTIANLFGLDVPDNLIGHDIFDDNYKGYVIFSNYGWLTDQVYYHDGIVNVYGDYSEDDVGQMTSYMYRRMKINEYLLTTDYYMKKPRAAFGMRLFSFYRVFRSVSLLLELDFQ